MKKFIIAAIAAFTIATVANNATAQSTNGIFSNVGNLLGSVGLTDNPTNLAIVPFAGLSTDGKAKQVAGLLVVENVNNNLGVVGGVDHLWGGGQANSANLVSGGLTLKDSFYPVQKAAGFIGLSLGTNTWAYHVKCTPYAVALIGTPINGTGNNGGVCTIARAGADLTLCQTHGWNLGVGADFGNRNGAGNYSGNYVDFIFSASKGF